MIDKAKQEAIQEARREKLVAYIRQNYPSATHPRGNVSAFAESVGKKQSQVADVLDKRKPFGEKLARLLETLVAERLVPHGKPPLRFDVGPEAVQTFYGVPLTREAVEIAAEWSRLRAPLKAVIRDLMRTSQPQDKKSGVPVERLQKRK